MSVSAIHSSKPAPKWLIMFVLTSAEKDAKRCRRDRFHLEESASGKKKKTHPHTKDNKQEKAFYSIVVAPKDQTITFSKKRYPP